MLHRTDEAVAPGATALGFRSRAKAAAAREEDDIEAATAQMGRALRVEGSL